jgi:hypothetical protein
MTTTDTVVPKSITVQATPERAFQVFTEGVDTWWPRSHHGSAASLRDGLEDNARLAIRAGGRKIE